ncbi:calcium-binding tyrosine phosphorylation-regulated protein-like [Polyodon spathula]|uniref:calcium-binding tyrosine phosphorylation-regulated protein-like n=1 Tax=Polyodon spathula TaxID=7913 RepID=UPI001B7E68F4|nr:calcium-binding tyrosine phosphorylation-regulated protein-like [Polyodon spathula]
MSRHQVKLVIPYGLKTLLEGVSRAVIRRQPENIQIFASCYFTELLKFRDAGQLPAAACHNRRMLETPAFADTVLRGASVVSPEPMLPDDTHEITHIHYESSSIRDKSVPTTGSSEHSASTLEAPNCEISADQLRHSCSFDSISTISPESICPPLSQEADLCKPDSQKETLVYYQGVALSPQEICYDIPGFQNFQSVYQKIYSATRLPSVEKMPLAQADHGFEDAESLKMPPLHHIILNSGPCVPYDPSTVKSSHAELGSSFKEHGPGVAAFHKVLSACEEHGTDSRSVYDSSKYNFESGIARSPSGDQDPNARCAVQSVVFQRVPSGVYDTSNSVLINTPAIPEEEVIIVHSENVPEAVVFHKLNEESCTSQSLLGPDESTGLHEKIQDEQSTLGKEYQVVVFQRVPSASQPATPSATQTVNQETAPVNAVAHSSAEALTPHCKSSDSGVGVHTEKAENGKQECVTAQQKAEALPDEAGSKKENSSQDDAGEVWTLYCLADFGAQGNMMQAQQYGSPMQQFVPEQPFYPMYQGTSPETKRPSVCFGKFSF